MRKPRVQVIGQSGLDLFPGWSSSSLMSVTYTDVDGGEADELEFSFSVSPPFQDSPAEGTRYRFLYGWEGQPLRDAGEFTYQSDALSGDAEGGYVMTIVARASDFIDADKAAETEHFDDMTAGEIFQSLAGRAGKQALIHPDIASVRLPYRLRFNQSLSGFANELAEELGGTLKFAGGKLLVPKRNGGQNANGRQLPTITIPFKSQHAFDIASEGRGRYQQVGTGFFDPLKGVQKLFNATSSGKASRFLGLHPARSEDEAELAGKAQSAELARGSISGSFDTDGSDEAMAGAPVRLSGFGASRDALDLVAASIAHTISFEDGGGWTMSVEVGMREGSKQ
ncbi:MULTISPECIES: hypothetical protein [unclassified Ensifer]|uniref:phage late control D family protein n=1 Tax=unclassified Ensifer TaxID=2633371 RepID=UPI000813AA7A|nr:MULTISPECIES: hypothetical protein [unclassified Ensifer]OCP17422.1 hypothetical protein BC361_08165 [Ensifer sp. LC54]OCP28672.1 hypothetical protein BC363_02190 [Ensifer sp. LC384]